MNKYITKIFFTIIILISIINLSFSQQRIVVIDAGHGGKDPGAMGKISKEKNIVLEIALKVGKYLTENTNNIKVIYTRTTDVFLSLEERADIANKNGADLFISLHVNALNNKKVYGTQTYVMGTHKNDENLELAVRENSAILYENNYKNKYSGYDPDAPETYIVMNLYQKAYRSMSIKLAENMQKEFKNRAGRKDKGVRQAGFLVLWQTTMPSILIEMGFITNRNEELYLNTEYGQDIIASAIFRAVRDYLIEN